MSFINKTISIFFISYLILFFPSNIFAQDSTPNTGIVYECRRPDPTVPGGFVYGDCSFNDLVLATRRVVNFGITLALSLSVIPIAMAGFWLLTSGDNTGNRAKAKRALEYVAIGIFFMLGAWMIVTLIANTLLTQTVRDVTPLAVP